MSYPFGPARRSRECGNAPCSCPAVGRRDDRISAFAGMTEQLTVARYRLELTKFRHRK